MSKVFIAYRHDDTAAIAGRIFDRLVIHFGGERVFFDVNIPPGVNFSNFILATLRQCSVVLVLIGREWLNMRTPDGTRRLDDPLDVARIEIETALSLDLTVIPLLVNDVHMPLAAELPKSLQPLCGLLAVPARNGLDFGGDMQRIITAVEQAFAAALAPAEEIEPSTGAIVPASPPSLISQPPGSTTSTNAFVWLRRLFLRHTITHPRILAGALVAAVLMGLGILLHSLSAIADLETRYVVSNGLAIVGLICTAPCWIASLAISVRLRQWLWLLLLLTVGLIPYGAALYFNSITAYLLAAVVPSLFGLIGPLQRIKKAG